MIIQHKEVIIFADYKGKEPFMKWLKSLDQTTQSRIESRILRLSLGNYGDHKLLKEGVYELRIHFGSGYRVYFGEDGKNIVILLSGGDKKTQKNDILEAIGLWHQYKGAK